MTIPLCVAQYIWSFHNNNNDNNNNNEKQRLIRCTPMLQIKSILSYAHFVVKYENK